MATHALLDAATSYGTMLLWPFSNERFAWKIVSVVDPLFSLPIIALVVLSALKRKQVFARLALVWAGVYLALGAVQHEAAWKMGRSIAETRGHTPVRLEVKPSFGNIVVWKSLYEAEGRYYVDAVRGWHCTAGFRGDIRVKARPYAGPALAAARITAGKGHRALSPVQR